MRYRSVTLTGNEEVVINSINLNVTQKKSGLSKNKVAMLAALIIMMLITAAFGYRLQISSGGFVFERGSSEQLTATK